MAMLTIVAQITAEPDQIEFVKSQLLGLIEKTRQEAGCRQYDLHQDNNDPSQFLFYENWESRELWEDHIQSEHILAYRAATEAAVQSVKILEMTKVD